MNDESEHERELGGQLLASVSRSFYLTLKALPRELREPISLAYLLARMADTIADTSEVPNQVRQDALFEFDRLIQNLENESAGVEQLSEKLATEFAPWQTDAAEKKLMLRLHDALRWLMTMSPGCLRNIRSVLATIISGQVLDLKRFPDARALASLQTSDELDDYTYRVAGCVGEFWTKLCFSEMQHVFADEVSQERASQLGIRFGKGLQLINILRDIKKDAGLGRCYMPQEQWQHLGLTTEQIRGDPTSLRKVCDGWMQICEDHMRAGVEYLQSLKHAKLRYATSLPLLLGAKTLAHLRKASDEQWRAGVKVSRLEVAKILFDATLSNTPEGLQRLFNKLAAS